MKSYEEMFGEAVRMMPESRGVSGRFEIPKVKGHYEGNKTVIANMNAILSVLGRDPGHVLKFLQKELATPASYDGPRLVLGRRVSQDLINQKIELYADYFVICYECGKPDTQIVEKEGIMYLKCTACGAQRKIRL